MKGLHTCLNGCANYLEHFAGYGAASPSINFWQLAAPPSFKTAFGNAFRTRISFRRAQRREVGRIGWKGEQIAQHILCLRRVVAEQRFNQSQQAAAEINERRPIEPTNRNELRAFRSQRFRNAVAADAPMRAKRFMRRIER